MILFLKNPKRFHPVRGSKETIINSLQIFRLSEAISLIEFIVLIGIINDF